MTSLKGLRVLNTRPKDQAQLLSRLIHQTGGKSIEFPALSIEFLPFKTPSLEQIDTVIFTSANAANAFFQQLKTSTWPKKIKVIAIGQGTARALLSHQISIDAIPTIADSEHLLALPELQCFDQHILLVKGEKGRELISEQLKINGTNLEVLCVYRRVMPAFDAHWVKSIWQDDLVDIILLTSEQSIHHLLKIFNEGKNWLQQKPCLVLSSRLAKAAALLGMQHIICTSPDKLMQSLLNYANKD